MSEQDHSIFKKILSEHVCFKNQDKSRKMDSSCATFSPIKERKKLKELQFTNYIQRVIILIANS